MEGGKREQKTGRNWVFIVFFNSRKSGFSGIDKNSCNALFSDGWVGFSGSLGICFFVGIWWVLVDSGWYSPPKIPPDRWCNGGSCVKTQPPDRHLTIAPGRPKAFFFGDKKTPHARAPLGEPPERSLIGE